MFIENTSFPQDPRMSKEARTLAAAGYSVSVIAPSKIGQPARERVDGISVYRYPSPAPSHTPLAYVWEYSYSLVAMFLLSVVVLFREGFDVIHTANPPDTVVVIALLYKLLGKKFVFDHHDLAPEMYYARFRGQGRRLVYCWLVLLEQLSCKVADHVLATNESYKRIEVKRSSIAESKVTVVRNGPHLATSEPTEALPEFRMLGKTILVFAGVMGNQDGVDHLLRALQHLRCDLGRSDFFCLFVGGVGEARPEMQALAKHLGLDSCIQFTGWVDSIWPYIASADIGLDPDPSNGFNDYCTMLKMMDYMCMGKPIVAFDLAEHRYTAGEAALYVPPNDEMEFARAIAQLMDDPDRRQRMGALGRRRVETTLAWHYSAQRLIGVYNSILPLPAAPPAEERVTRNGVVAKISASWQWLQKRSIHYAFSRGWSLIKRYGVSDRRAEARVRRCVELLKQYGCRPTFAVPGRLVNRVPQLFVDLQQAGVELAVHGYDHVDFHTLTPQETDEQLRRAVVTYSNAGIRFDGIRCPYLSGTEYLHKSMNGTFRYTSHKAIWWDCLALQPGTNATFRALSNFYRAHSSKVTAALPSLEGHVIELPVAVPDDIQMIDGMKLSSGQIARSWVTILRETYRRGELFVLLFHPETFFDCPFAFESVLQEARQKAPAIWITQLRDVAAWWQERRSASVEIVHADNRNVLQFACPADATILVRGLTTPQSTRAWDGRYQVLESRTLELGGSELPIIGLHPEASEQFASWLNEGGYIFRLDESPAHYSIYLGPAESDSLTDQPALFAYLENSSSPLVRISPWPNAARSALCITGDLDALSLRDYFSRLSA